MKDFGTVSTHITEVAESPLIWMPNVSDFLTLQIDGTGTLANASMALYENGQDVSSTKLTGSLTIPTGGRTIKTKTLQSMVGGNVYHWYVYFTDDGVTSVREGLIICPKLGVRPSKVYPNALDRLRVSESPITIYPSQSATFDLVIDGSGTIEASSPAPTMYLYKGTTDDSSNTLSDSISVTNRVITLKTIGSLAGGSEYIAYIFFTDNGKQTCRYFEIICPKLGI